MTLDIIVIAIAIIAVILGFKVGFLTYILKIASIFTGLITTIVLVGPVHNMVLDGSIGQQEIQRYVEKIENSDFYVGGGGSVTEILKDVGMPGVVATVIGSFVSDDITGDVLVYTLSEKVASITIWIKVFFIMLIATTILVWIIKICIKQIRKIKFIKFLDGVLGLLLSCALSIVVGYIILSVIMVTTEGGMFSVFGSFMSNQYEKSLGIYRFFYDHNFIYSFFNLFFN